jgi:hypothetical protein
MILKRRLCLVELEERITPSATFILNAGNPTVTYTENFDGSAGDVVTLHFADGGSGGNVMVNVGGSGGNANDHIDLIKFDGLCNAAASFSATVEGTGTNPASNGIIDTVRTVNFDVPTAGPGAILIEGNITAVHGTTVTSLTVASNNGTAVNTPVAHTLGGNLGHLTLNKIDGGSIQVDGNASRITSVGAFGAASATTLTVNGNLDSLRANTIDNSTIVLGSVGKIAVIGGFGSGVPNALTVVGDLGALTAANIQDSSITIVGGAGTIAATGLVTGGEFSSTLIVGHNLKSLTATNIDSSSINIIGTANKIAAANNFNVSSLSVGHNLGSLTAVNISSSSISIGNDAGKIAATGDVSVTGLTVRSDLRNLTGANISSSGISIGDDAGNIAATANFGVTGMTVGGDLSSLTAKNISSSSISVSGDAGKIAATGDYSVTGLTIGSDLRTLTAKNIISSGISVDGNVGKIAVTGDFGVTGLSVHFDLRSLIAKTATSLTSPIIVGGSIGTFSMPLASFSAGTIETGGLKHVFDVLGEADTATRTVTHDLSTVPVITTANYVAGGTLIVHANVPDSRFE